MKRKLLFTILFSLGLSLAVAAQDDFPDDLLEDGAIELTDPELIIDEDFSDEDAWQSFDENTYSAQVDEDDEVYVIEVEFEEDNNFTWGQDSRIIGNVVMQFETEQLSDEDNNGYGVMCRADPSYNGSGYRFYISGDGWVSIVKIDSTEDPDDQYEYLYDWTESDAINQGEDDNELVVICVDDYLGFYVNGELVAEAFDDTFDEGAIAFAASIYVEDEDIEVTFDNLLVWEVEAGDSGRSGRSSTSGRGSSDDMDVDDIEDDIADMLEDGDVEIALDDVLLVETWDELGEWEEHDEDDYLIEVDDDAYRVEEYIGLFTWGSNQSEHDDVVMQVEVERFSDGLASAFGLMCRLDTDNLSDGYSFLISSDGYYSIGYWEDGDFTTLLEANFVESSDLEVDTESYTITIVCVDEYLALYVDGELIGEVEDDTFDEGYAAIAAIAFDDDGVEVAFDNLIIWEASD